MGEGGGRERIQGIRQIFYAETKAWNLYPWREHYRGNAPGEKRSANTSVLISPEGKILASYSKLHMFDITLTDSTPFNESDKSVGEKL